MQLSYRGVKYDSPEPAIEVIESQEVGQYRGAIYHVRRAAKVTARKSSDVLKYRGAIVH